MQSAPFETFDMRDQTEEYWEGEIRYPQISCFQTLD